MRVICVSLGTKLEMVNGVAITGLTVSCGVPSYTVFTVIGEGIADSTIIF